MAKEEFEQEVHARHEAELEMARLKQQIVEQASKLATMTSEKRREEHLQRRSQEVKSSLQGMERDLAKLTVERDLTVAEVAELVAMQDGRADLMKDSHSAGTSAITRNLSVRLEGVKEKYRKEIDELTFERDALLIEIEELKQSREVFLEETAALNARNDELNEVLSQVSRQIDRANQDAARMQHMQASLRDPQGKGQGAGFLPFGKQNRHPNGSPSISSSNDTHFNLSTPVNQTSDPGHEMKVVKPEKIEPAPVVKKFKWMKPKLSDSAKNAGQNIASALPMGQSPPVPPKPSAPSPTPLQASQRNLSNEIVVREHLFQPFNVLRPTRCFACQKNMWGQSEVRCALCGQACHSKCLQNLPTSCNQPFSRGDEPTEPAGPSMFGKDLVEQAQLEQRSVPLVVEKCIQAVEALGE